jgi:hypothetical protein
MVDLNRAPEHLRKQWVEEWLTDCIGGGSKDAKPKVANPDERRVCNVCGDERAKRWFKLGEGIYGQTCKTCRLLAHHQAPDGFKLTVLPPAGGPKKRGRPPKGDNDAS